MADLVDNIVRVSDNVIKMYVKRYPQRVNLPVYRGDSWSFTIIGLNGDGTPFDWSICEAFEMNFRIGHPLNPEAAVVLTDDNFVLGRTDLNHTAYDEIHLVDPPGDLFAGLMVQSLFYDFQYTIGGDPYTAIKGKAAIEFDVTREMSYA